MYSKYSRISSTKDRFGSYIKLTYKEETQGFRLIKAGSFLMGSPDNEHFRDPMERQHKVSIKREFYMADTTVTQKFWMAVMGSNPSFFKGYNLPVETISWNNIQIFLLNLNNVVTGLKLSLPTESQWEYCCRAGTTTPFFWGETINSKEVNFLDSYSYKNGIKNAWRKKTLDGLALRCNDWGIYQMHGNVWEWCQDWYDVYPINLVSDPSGPEIGRHRVLRGGAWINKERYCRSADRGHLDPSTIYNRLGFRLVMYLE